ncbi:hypothetical protein ACJMK2_029674 [Sinanodonta woodiana]|uniref:Dynamin N-terminal domain-containing protein n=1 Tax=Sinanodonta woodiana TaxID=1069815 RepID=A0ABD3XBF5_SINWO
MQNKDNKDDTDENVPSKPKVKQIVAMFDGIRKKAPGQTDLDREDNIRKYAESSPNKVNTNNTTVDQDTDDMPTQVKGKGGLWNEPCQASDNENELGSDVIEEGSETTNTDVIRSNGTVIDGMSYAEIAKLMESLNMNVTSMEEDKEKLKRRLFRGPRIHTYSQQIKGVFNTKLRKYKELTQKMLELCSSLIATVHNESFMKTMSEVTNKRFPDYETKLESINTMLRNMSDEFEIVVTGETSSGKSTFLNVLIGDRILPSHHLHTTASLCRLHNSENKRLNCSVNDVTVDKISMNADSSELRRELESITKKLLSGDGDEEPLKVIDIYWPISSLHENIVLVDTPGIGERDVLTKQVVEFVPKYAGYIFVVDSSRAGGVQDYGIRQLIEAIAVSASNEDHMNGLSNALFVCNKWDLVPKQDREAVLKDTKRKISKYCGQLEEWQIVQFNADLDLKLQEWKASPTDSFKTLLESLDTLMIRAIETRLRDKFRWLSNFLRAVNGLVTMRITAAELSMEKAHLEMKTARTYLDNVTKKLEKVEILFKTVVRT